jgi:DNA-binding MarR family transcriptional regulator
MNYAMHSHPSYTILNTFDISPLAKNIFGMISVFSKETGKAFICRKIIAETLNCAITSVSRALTVLEKENLVKRTGEFLSSGFPIVTLTDLGKSITNGISTASDQTVTPPIPQSHPPSDHAVTHNYNINNSELKETTNSEKNVVVENLTKFGIAKNQAKKLKLKYPQEIITKQVQHLEQLLKSNTIIKNPAGWLIKAIENNFDIKIEEQPIIPIINHLETQDKLKQEAKEQAMQDARRAISDEAFNKLYQEELNKLTNSLQRFGIIAIAPHHKEAAHYNAMERLI